MFSATVKLASVSDYIAPSQSCVVNLRGGKLSADDDEVGAVHIRRPQQQQPGGWSQTLPSAPGGPVKISLHDCLACSGCVTSAEAVLLEQQSVGELRAALSPGAYAAVVVSLSPQSRASLAAALRVPAPAAAAALRRLFSSLGCALVVDVAACRELSLLEQASELARRVRAGGPLPVLASACPGWVCYAEKHRDAALLVPLLSTVKSPQAVAGALVKRLWAAQNGHSPESVFHAAVMPCYDKKLEAARGELTFGGAPETDCVLTTGEVLRELLGGDGGAAAADRVAGLAAEAGPADPAWHAVAGGAGGDDGAWNAPGGGSGGHAEAAARGAAAALWGVPHEGPIPWAPRAAAGPASTDDFCEATLSPPAGAALLPGARPLRLARVYGFRSITTLVRLLKQQQQQQQQQQRRPGAAGAPPPPPPPPLYDFVEVMACPGGCLNGGGQAAPPAGAAPRGALAAAAAAYGPAGGVAERPPGGHPLVAATYAALGGGGPGSDAAREALHTTLRVRAAGGRAAAAAAPGAGDW